MSKSDAGKGDLVRPTDWDKYHENYERLFHPKCPKCGQTMKQIAPHIRRFHCTKCEGGGYDSLNCLSK
jgi:ribosomal protein S27AE